MDEKAILNCQIGSWYRSFEQVTYRTRLIELPDSFVEYLLQDGVFLPEQSAAVRPPLPRAVYFANQTMLVSFVLVLCCHLLGVRVAKVSCFSASAWVVHCQSWLCLNQNFQPSEFWLLLKRTWIWAQLPVRSKPDEYADYQDWSEEETEQQDAEEEASKVPSRLCPPPLACASATSSSDLCCYCQTLSSNA